MIGHDFQRMQRGLEFSGFAVQQDFQAFVNRSHQDRFAVLRAEDEVILEGEDRASVACIPVMFHTTSIAHRLINYNYLTQKGQGKTAVLLAQDVHSSAS